MIVDSWVTILQKAFLDVFSTIVNFIPNLVAAVVVFAIGWLFGVILSQIAGKLVKALNIDKALRYAGAEEMLARGGVKLNSAGFTVAVVKWLVITAFLMFSLNVIGLQKAALFIEKIIGDFLPQVVLAAAILIITAVVAKFVDGIVTSSAKAASVTSAKIIGNLSRAAIWVMGGFTALTQFDGLDVSFIYTLFTGFVVALSLAFGLAFGLGGQKAAAEIIEKFRKDA